MAALTTAYDTEDAVGAQRNDLISTRAGYLPVSLTRSPIQALANIPVYIRTTDAGGAAAVDGEAFILFSASTLPFDEDSRRRLLSHGAKFVYIPISEHEKFRRQTESQIEDVVSDPQMAAAAKWAVVYETSNELASELLSQRSLAANLPRLQNVSRAVSKLVLNDRSAFEHLFAASHHDFYTATHMVNVGTWMVALAYAMGHRDEAELCSICQAGVLHDVGKTLVSKEILNKTGQLTAEEWACLRSHPSLGVEYLKKAGVTDPVVLEVASQHHERLDGSGYPSALRGDQINPIARMCSVIDTFDAMTSLRPFKNHATSVPDAVDAILQETPLRYDQKVVTAWADLVRGMHPEVPSAATMSTPDRNRRKLARSDFSCPVMVRIRNDDGRFDNVETVCGTATNVSAAGMSLLMPVQIIPGQLLKLHLKPHKARITKEYTAVCMRCRTYDDGWFEVGVQFRLE